MSDKIGPRCANGSVVSTGAAINIVCGFRPAMVIVQNVTGEVELSWNRSMAAGYGFKRLGVSSGTNANESSHTHAVALDSGASGAEAAHTHAAGAITVTPHADSAGTPAGTNAASAVSPHYEGDSASCTKPVIALTHNADPVVNLSAAALYGVEGYGDSVANVITLQSTTAANANVLGETANGVGGGVAASCRFFVFDNDAPAGVPIYVNEAANDQLEFVSPTATDGYIVMPFEMAAGGIPGFSVRVVVHHNAAAAGGKPLYFDDNGAADAQLVFVDAGGVGGVIPAADISVMGNSYLFPVSGNLGQAAAQVFSGSALGDHSHASTAAGADTAAGSSHTHGAGTLADAASGTGSAHTHVFTGAAAESALITTGGITSKWDGFSIGTDANVNPAGGNTIYWMAWRF